MTDQCVIKRNSNPPACAVHNAVLVREANSGPLGIQSLSEAIAKHLKNDYLRQDKF